MSQNPEAKPTLTRRDFLKISPLIVAAFAAHTINPLDYLRSFPTQTLPDFPITPTENPKIKTGRVNEVDVLKFGDGAKQILYLHPLGRLAEGHKGLILPLAEHAEVTAVNLFDLVSKVDSHTKNPTYSDLVAEIWKLDVLNPHKPLGIVAISFGATVGWHMAAQHPDKISFLTTASPLGYPIERPLFSYNPNNWVSHFIKMIIQDSRDQKTTGKPPLEGGEVLGLFKRNPVGFAKTIQLTIEADAREAIKSVNSPVDITRGELDEFVPRYATMGIVNLLKTPNYSEVKGLGHTWDAYMPELIVNQALARLRDQ